MAVMAPWREDDALCSEENLSRHNASYLAGLVSTPSCGKSDKLFMPRVQKIHLDCDTGPGNETMNRELRSHNISVMSRESHHKLWLNDTLGCG